MRPELSGEETRRAAISHIAIVGDGLAAHMTAATLAAQLPEEIRLTLVRTGQQSAADILYGTVAGPAAYSFNLEAGLSEPRLVLDSDCAFSWGSSYTGWGTGARAWVQGYQLPFPVIDGVTFQHYLTQQGIDRLDPFLFSSVAAQSGKFAHPPQQGTREAQQPSGRAEYGYQFDPRSYADLFARIAGAAGRVEHADALLDGTDASNGSIRGLTLEGGRQLTADIYVDCTGPDARLIAGLQPSYHGERVLAAAVARKSARSLGAAVRDVRSQQYGWRATTPVRDGSVHLAVFDLASEDAALADLGAEAEDRAQAQAGRREEAWTGNCVAIGQACGVIEPLTPAPMMLLQGDIQRFVSLIPVGPSMDVERREFNRRFRDDFDHAQLFNRAFFETTGLPETPYWQSARSAPIPEKLARKITMFESRGVLVQYDLEPFHAEDWMVMHYGMGRVPRRNDISADRAPPERVAAYLEGLMRQIDMAAAGLPPHADYMTQLAGYLRQNRY